MCFPPNYAPLGNCLANNKGQALVEFTLIFILLLIVAWIPADFGMAMYTGQLAQNASREGARLAAADRNPGVGTCTMPCATATGILAATRDRLSSALMPGAVITVTLQGGTTCDRLVTVNVTGTYNFFFYRVLKLIGIGGNTSTVDVQRQTSMRWEHQC